MEVNTALEDSKAVSLTLWEIHSEEAGLLYASSISLLLRVISFSLISFSTLVMTTYTSRPAYLLTFY